jgi:6-phosphofructokinase 2
MTRFAVRTLTLNPSIDVSSEADRVEPEKKVRTCCERIDPGGGGINVARVLGRLGATVEAIYLAGGATGDAFEALLKRQNLVTRRVAIADDTRTSLTIHERSGGREFRFVPEGPTISADELDRCRDAIAAAECDFFVASGSLPPGVPNTFYAEVATLVAGHDARFILDTSGAELEAALQRGGIHLLKASREEMERDTAAAIVSRGQADHVALTLGQGGALFVAKAGTWFLPTLHTAAESTVGAGDSFLAGMTFGMVDGRDVLDAFRMAVAAGAAATLSPGTDLAYPDDIRRMLQEVPTPQKLD